MSETVAFESVQIDWTEHLARALADEEYPMRGGVPRLIYKTDLRRAQAMMPVLRRAMALAFEDGVRASYGVDLRDVPPNPFEEN